MCAPGPVLSALVDDEILLHRRSSSPLARRIAASVPAGTVSESLPATVIARVPSGLRHVSWEPVRRARDQPAAISRLRTSRYFFGIASQLRHGAAMCVLAHRPSLPGAALRLKACE